MSFAELYPSLMCFSLIFRLRSFSALYAEFFRVWIATRVPLRQVRNPFQRFPGPRLRMESELPPQKMGTILGIIAVLPGKGIVQVVDNKGMGDTGFEPVTSTV